MITTLKTSSIVNSCIYFVSARTNKRHHHLHAGEALSSDVDRLKKVVNVTFRCTIPCHKVSDFTSKKNGLHLFVLERKNVKKGFPYLLRTEWLGGAILVKNCVGIWKIGPESLNTMVNSIFEEVVFVLIEKQHMWWCYHHDPNGALVILFPFQVTQKGIETLPVNHPQCPFTNDLHWCHIPYPTIMW
jgi:hypothetical protein